MATTDENVSTSAVSFKDIHGDSQQVLFPDPVFVQRNENNIKINDTSDQLIKNPKQISDPHQIEKEVTLKRLSVQQVCLLLDNQNLSSIKPVVIENEISGMVLAASVDTVEDLKEIGIKPMQAKALFKLIEEWKAHEIPADFFKELSSAEHKLSSGSSAELTTKAAPSSSSRAAVGASTTPGTALKGVVISPTEVRRVATVGQSNSSAEITSSLPYMGFIRGSSSAAPSVSATSTLNSSNRPAPAATTRPPATASGTTTKPAAPAPVSAVKVVAKAEPTHAPPVPPVSTDTGPSVIKVVDEAAEMEKLFLVARYCWNTIAYQQLIAAAEKGNHQAEAYLGILYTKRCSVFAKDADKSLLYTQRALPWLQAEVIKGNKYAQNLLGWCYQDGRGVTQNISEAVGLYKLAADQIHAGAQYNLGWCYQTGTGVSKNLAEADRFSRLAAGLGHTQAQCNLGVCYANGTGVTKNEAEAVRHYKLAADQGNLHAQYHLGICYIKGTGVPIIPTKGVELLQVPAHQGYPDAQWYLGWCYANGRGITKNLFTAVRLFEAAADQGSIDALLELATLYSTGTEFSTNLGDAAKYYKRAADLGHAGAQYNIGVFFQKGTGVAKNKSEAKKYLKMAADQGYAGAAAKLNKYWF